MKSGSKKPKSDIRKSSFVAEKPNKPIEIEDTEEKANDLS